MKSVLRKQLDREHKRCHHLAALRLELSTTVMIFTYQVIQYTFTNKSKFRNDINRYLLIIHDCGPSVITYNEETVLSYILNHFKPDLIKALL